MIIRKLCQKKEYADLLQKRFHIHNEYSVSEYHYNHTNTSPNPNNYTRDPRHYSFQDCYSLLLKRAGYIIQTAQFDSTYPCQLEFRHVIKNALSSSVNVGYLLQIN